MTSQSSDTSLSCPYLPAYDGLSAFLRDFRTLSLEVASILVDLTIFADTDEDDTVTLYEVWRDQAALDAHMQSDHYRGFQRALGKCTRDCGKHLVHVNYYR